MTSVQPDPLLPADPVAYFCMEVALSSDIPTYAGGLGVLAGDLVRGAADAERPPHRRDAGPSQGLPATAAGHPRASSWTGPLVAAQDAAGGRARACRDRARGPSRACWRVAGRRSRRPRINGIRVSPRHRRDRQPARGPNDHRRLVRRRRTQSSDAGGRARSGWRGTPPGARRDATRVSHERRARGASDARATRRRAEAGQIAPRQLPIASGSAASSRHTRQSLPATTGFPLPSSDRFSVPG